MFEDTLIESQKTIKTRRGLTTFISVLLQCVAVAIVVLIPLMFTQALPTRQLVTMLVAPPPPPPPPPPPSASKVQPTPKPVTNEVTPTGQLRTPTRIPKEIAMVKEAQPPAPSAVGGVVGGVPGGVAGGQIGGVIGGVLSSAPAAVPKIAPQRVRVSQGVVQGLLTHKVEPQYPAMARNARVQGTVVLHAVIGKDGKVKNLQVVSGHPMLASSAVNAVKQWQYKPYMLNGQPVEIDTTINVNFKLAT